MTIPGDAPRDWKETVGDWLWARWRWLAVAVVLLFALNNLAGMIAGAVGLISFLGRFSGRLLAARRMAEEVRQVVSGPDGQGEDPKRKRG